MEKTSTTVDAYIANFPKDVQKLLKQLRTTIKKAAPKATEKISYHMPAYSFEGVLLYFGGFKNHIGLYAMPSAIKAFAGKLSAYETSKGTIKLPIDKPIPTGLVTKIVKFRIQENLAKKKAKASRKKK
ncbi:iron chaperone [Bdellovibrio sp. HCB337]|uniref:iron chaperone n=1 Tax=Bdellovibrio sp. HCB337 TaxID=3394358 RepID=UPI0039A40AFB